MAPLRVAVSGYAAPTFDEVVEIKPDVRMSAVRIDRTAIYHQHPLHGDVLPDQPPTPVGEEKPFEEMVEFQKQQIQNEERGSMLKTQRKAIVRETLAITDNGALPIIDLREQIAISDTVIFQSVVTCFAILNTLVIGFEADYGCWGCPIGERLPWYLLDNVFTSVFVIEMLLRIFGRNPIHYILGDGVKGYHLQWLNCIDCLIVLSRAVDTWALMPANVETKIKILSCFRIIRAAPLIKRMRLHRHVRDLWIIISLLTDTYKIIFWVLVLMCVVIWITAIALTHIVHSGETNYDYHNAAWSWKDYWGNVPRSMFSLFQVVTLDKWAHSLVRPLVERKPWIFLFFAVFICLTSLGLVNVIVAIVVESTIASAAANDERMNKKLQKVYTQVMQSLQMIFEDADTDKSGDLDTLELHHMLQKANVRDRLDLLDITIKDLNLLFELLDSERNGSISCDRFFRGCARLRGTAAACDLHRMSIDFSRYVQWTADLVGHNRNTNKRLSNLIYDISGVDRDILKAEFDDQDPVLMARRGRALKESDGWDAWDQDAPHHESEGVGDSNRRRATMRHEEIDFVRDDIRVLHGQRLDRTDREAPPPPPLPSHLMRRVTQNTQISGASDS